MACHAALVADARAGLTTLVQIVQLDADGIESHSGPLAQLLLEAHAAGMALGLAPNLTRAGADDAWRRVAALLAPGEHVQWAAFEADELLGAVHLARATAGNGRHRAEIQRLVVAADARGRGVGRALLDAAVERARSLGLRLLWLSTHEGSDADRIYPRLGWTRSGVIPDYARLPNGDLAGNAFYYLKLANID
jgi:GNAT superfamily N-acetyltransferase